ncbi:MAG: DMT family transporter [Chloroflexi bacterium]|nr:DMT family transporter [Chloroflexota bacterium]
MNQSSTNLARGYPIALLSTVFLSTTAIFIRYLITTYQPPALLLAFWRAALAAVVLITVLALVKPALLRVTRAQFGYLVLYGLLLCAFNSLWTLSVAINGAAVSNVLVYCSTAFTALLGWWLLKERLTPLRLLMVVICFSGCVFVSQAYTPQVWSANLSGILAGLLSGLGYAAYSLMGRSASQRGLNPWSTLVYTFFFAALFLGLINLLPFPIPATLDDPSRFLWFGNAWQGWGLLFLLAAVPTLMGYGLYMVSLSFLPSSTANLIATVEPVLTIFIAFFFLGERLSLDQIFGSVLIIGGVVLLRVFEGRRAPSPAAVEPASLAS